MILNKYEIGEEIKRGAFGCILKGFYNKTREPVAIKIEYGGIQSLQHEVKIINYLTTSKVKQIPDIYWYGIYNENPCLIFTLYECSLFDYMNHKNITTEKMNILMIKAIDILEHIHRVFVLHRDIKPQNFMIKNADIFLIDFGLATFYIDERGQHYPNKSSDTLVGTPKFVSIHIHDGHRYSRRDDIISLGYLYVFMVFGHAPWFPEKIQVQTDTPRIHIDHPLNQIMKTNKRWISFVEYIHGFHQIRQYMEYAYTLEYIDDPKYIPMNYIFLDR